MEPKQPSSSAHPADGSPEKSGWKRKLTEIIDVVVKLVPAAAVVATALIANNFQSAMSTTNLLSQREQADSTLRANMFQGLIDPILGFQKNHDIPLDREQLMVELLALNFHENFELKPIMLHVENRLVQEKIKKINYTGETPQESLRSIARRVLQRQLAAITKVEGDSSPGQKSCIYRIDLKEASKEGGTEKGASSQPCSLLVKKFKEPLEIKSPNGAYTLYLQIQPPKSKSWEDESFPVQMQIQNNKSTTTTTTTKATADNDFLLTWFDFPFTDNTLLADGTRFSLVINEVDAKNKNASFKLVWFPQDYFSARERPTNHRQFREKLGMALKQ
ncbi:MAG: hypothetical protein M3A44_07085 [Gammaproteobacteria bacterium]